MRLRVDCPISLSRADPDEAALFVAGRSPAGIASLAAKRRARSEKRQNAKLLEVSALLSEALKDGRTARSWRTAVLKRMAAELAKPKG